MIFEPRGHADGLMYCLEVTVIPASLPGSSSLRGSSKNRGTRSDDALTGRRGWKTTERLGDGRRWCWRNAALVAQRRTNPMISR